MGIILDNQVGFLIEGNSRAEIVNILRRRRFIIGVIIGVVFEIIVNGGIIDG